MLRRTLVLVAVVACLGLSACCSKCPAPVAAAAPAADPLPSWNDSGVKSAIMDYLAAITDPAHADFIPVEERVAILDNDGTSWCERPDNVPRSFQVGLLRSLVESGHTDGTEMPFRAWLEGDRQALREFGYLASYEHMNARFAGMPVTAYRDSVRAFLERARHSQFGVRYTELYYTPMRELKDLLEHHRFQVWIITGGPQDFVRAYIEDTFGIAPERVVGSWTTPVYEHHEDGSVSMVRGAVQQYNGHEHKPAHVELRIGRRPVFAAGNSNNDEPMCRWAATGPRRSLALWIHHDDAEREDAYDRGTSRIAELCGDLPQAHEVSMTKHWGRVFDHE